MKRITLILIAVLFLGSVVPTRAQMAPGCDAPTIHAVATIGMVADVIRNVGGTCVEVKQMMGAGVDPHLYRASEGDVFTLLDADVIFYVGLHLEARMAEIFEQMRIMNIKPTVPVGDAIPEDLLFIEPTFHQIDPHVWMDASLWAYTINVIRDQLIVMDPSGEAYYTATPEAYHTQLEALDAYMLAQVQRVPEEQRVLITAHDAFYYFGQRYGIEVFAPQGITTATEAGVEDIRRTIDIIVQRRIPAVFVESSVPPDVIEAIVEGAQAQGQTLSIGGSLYSDSMGDAGTFEGTYIGMMTHNVDTIVTALLGQSERALTPQP